MRSLRRHCSSCPVETVETTPKEEEATTAKISSMEGNKRETTSSYLGIIIQKVYCRPKYTGHSSRRPFVALLPALKQLVMVCMCVCVHGWPSC